MQQPPKQPQVLPVAECEQCTASVTAGGVAYQACRWKILLLGSTKGHTSHEGGKNKRGER